MRTRGTGGLLKVGYQQAAVLGGWTAEINRQRVVITAAVQSIDSFWYARDRFDVVLRVESRTWIWRNVSRQSDSPLTLIASGAPESAR